MKNVLLFACTLLLLISNTIFSQENKDQDSINIAKKNKDKHPYLSSKFIVNAAVFRPSKSIEVRADGSTPNDLIDFSETFELNERETTFAGNFKWRFSKNWNVSVEYFGIKSGHSTALTEDIEWNDIVYKTGFEIKGGFEVDLYRVFFGRKISTGDKHELGGGLGFHVMDILTYVEGEAFIDGMNTGFKREELTLLAPLPNIGFWYHYAPTSKLLLMMRTDWLALKISNIKGRLWNVSPGIHYQVFKNIGVNASYRYFSLKVDVEESDWNGTVNLKFDGPMFAIYAVF